MSRSARLPRGMGEVLRTIYECIKDELPTGSLCLMGGTALEAMWRHRISEDIDLFLSPNALKVAARQAAGKGIKPINMMDESKERLGRHGSLERRLKETGEERILPCGSIDGIRYEISISDFVKAPEGEITTLEGTPIRLGEVEETIRGKIQGRWVYEATRTRGQTPLTRDLYDIMIASVKVDNVLGIVGADIGREERKAIARWLEKERKQGSNTGKDEIRGAIAPRFQEQIAEVSKRIEVGIVRGEWGHLKAVGRKLITQTRGHEQEQEHGRRRE